ncbi:mazG family protein [Eubacterium sp. CAG:786]|nr:mazG family protein [Eubacterium sp. CAG:786]
MVKNMVDFDFKDRYDINDLRHIIELLRSENGCPWDKVQTHESIRTDLIEETYEVCEGIDQNSPEMLREELGDLLLQIVFHAQIERENGNFNFDDVCNDICQKLVYRHPHVFGEIKADDTDTVLKNWDALKKESKHQETYTETLESVPKTFPALLRGEKLCKRASRAGFPINDAGECADAIRSGLDRLEESGFEVNSQNQQTLGNLLLDFCNLDRILKVDGEKALTYASNQFIIDFSHAEKTASESGKKFDELTPDEIEAVKKKVFSGR